jgi:uncharacterized protein (UPF0332 family)
MKKPGFLTKLKEEGKLELVEPSDDICGSYLEKADNCFKSARLLYQNDLFENSVSMSYYAMYDSITALLFKAGIKCENHAGSILIFKRLFNRNDLFKTISFAKEERIDKQYYVTSKQDSIGKESAQDMLSKAEVFLIQVKLIIQNLRNEDIKSIREKFKSSDY